MRSSERHTTLTALLCSEDGLVHCLENVFLLGFKSARMFVGKNYLWDYFGKLYKNQRVFMLLCVYFCASSRERSV